MAGVVQISWRALQRTLRRTAEQMTDCSSSAERPIRTASLDGLRGVAAFFVFNYHYLWPYTATMRRAYGADHENMHWIQLPVVNLLLHGRTMVALFFAISGYVLSHGFLVSIRSGRHAVAVTKLFSMALRRWPRLFLPPTLSTFAVCLASFIGLFGPMANFQDADKPSKWFLGYHEELPRRNETLAIQLEDYARGWLDWVSPFDWEHKTLFYDPHVWTIPKEFQGAITLFVFLLVALRLKTVWRLSLCTLSFVYTLVCTRWEISTFFGGCFVADLLLCFPPDHELPVFLSKRYIGPADDPTAQSLRRHLRSRLHRRALLSIKAAIACCGLYLLSFPSEASQQTPGYQILYQLTPAKSTWNAGLREDVEYFWLTIGASLILWSIETSTTARDFFSSTIPQYLGRISFGFYLVHGPVINSLGYAIVPRILDALHADTSDGRWYLGLALGWLVLLATSLVLGQWFTRFVDDPIVRGLRTLEKSLCRLVQDTPKNELEKPRT